MPCITSRDEISDLVIDKLNEVLDKKNITEETELDGDLGLDKQARELLFFDIRDSVLRDGCKFKKFTAVSCGKASNVGAIVDIIAEDFDVAA